MKKSALLFAITSISVMGLNGCVTTGSSTDPTKVGFTDGLTYQLGINDELDAEIERRKARSVVLQQELNESREKLRVSKSRLEELEKELSEVSHKTESARNKARKIKAELRLKKQDLKNKSRELADLEQQIKALKINKSSGKESLERLTRVEMELSSTNEEIAVLTNYLKDDLFIRAENSLKYD